MSFVVFVGVEKPIFPLQITDVAFKPLGWIIRYAMVLRDNYLGSFTNFSTLYEYLEKRKRGIAIGDPIASKYRKGNVRGLLFFSISY